MELWNLTTRRQVVPEVVVADRWWRRLRGLMARRHWPTDRALMITPCTSIHTCFVRFAIDVIYLGAGGTVLRVVAGLRPWRVSVGPKGTTDVVELYGGTLASRGVRRGDVLCVCRDGDAPAGAIQQREAQPPSTAATIL